MGSEKGIGRVERIKLRRVWGHEARDFTVWLEENLDVLSEATGLELVGAEREQAAGSFSVDLIAEDEKGHTVVIENQLEKTDHDHLGKLLTYLVNVEAQQAIWVTADPRPEHVGTIAWLNESASADFFLLKLEAIRIGDSDPAALLTLIVGPSDETREVERTKKKLAGREKLRRRFFAGLLERARDETALHANVGPGTANWVGAGSGIAGLRWTYVVREHDARVELYIDTPASKENQRIFKELSAEKQAIEHAFGDPLDWDEKEGRRSRRIAKTYGGGGLSDEKEWEAVHGRLIDGMIKLEAALQPHLKKACN